MTAQPVEANVVLTADNSQYNQAMDSSTQSTNQLGAAIDGLGQKINNLSKSAGRKLLGITAGDVAMITGATAAWASYEKQISRLQSQAAILTKTEAGQTKVLGDYTRAVNTLRSTFGTTTTEAAKLVETLSKVTNIQQSRGLTDLSKVFIEMSEATGESSEGLASSLTNLQRLMGTPINAQTTKKYADQFTYLAAQTQTSAQGLIDFTAQLAPIGRNIGLTQTQITGFATAFAKSGQDGFVAANAFSKFTSDINNSLTTGSSELAEYANIVGKTRQEFQKLAKDRPQEALTEIAEALGRMGPRAATELQRLGLGDPRTLRSLQAVLNQPGGIRESQTQARLGLASGAAAEGAAATDSITRSFERFREEIKQTAETMGSYFAPVAESFANGMDKFAKTMNNIVEGPLGQFLSMIMGLVAPLAGGAGMLALFAGALLKVASAFLIFKNSASRGVFEGFRGGAAMTRVGTGAEARYIAAGGEGAYLGPTGARLARGGTPGLPRSQQSTWMQRGLYNIGQPIGAGLSSVRDAMTEGYHRGREFADESYVRPTQGRPTGIFSYMAGGLSRGLEQFINPQFDQMRFEDETKRSKWLAQESPWSKLSQRMKLSGAMGDVGLAQTQMTKIGEEEEKLRKNALLTNEERTAREAHLKTIKTETQARLTAAQESETAARETITATKEQTEAVKSSAVGFRRLFEVGGKGLVAGAGGAMLGGARFAAGTLARSDLAMPATGALGMAAMSGLGIDSTALNMGAMGLMFGSPVMAAAGLGIGAVLDARSQAKNFAGIQAARAQALKAGMPEQMVPANLAAISEFKPYQTQEERNYWERLTHPGDIAGGIGRGLTSAYTFLTTGKAAYTEREKEATKAEDQNKALIGAMDQLSQAEGKKALGALDLNRPQDVQKLGQVITDLTPTMEKLGITTEDIISTFEG